MNPLFNNTSPEAGNPSKSAFNEALADLVETASINGGMLTKDEIKQSLDGILTDESLYHMVYDYMAEKNITVEGYTATVSAPAENAAGNTRPSAAQPLAADTKEQVIIDLYLKDMENLSHSPEEELSALIDYLEDRENSLLLNRLTEMSLHIVPPLADTYKNQGVPYGDLLQEGNLGLMEGILTFVEDIAEEEMEEEALFVAFHRHLSKTIQNAMKDCLAEQEHSTRISIHAADLANELDRASVALSKELDRAPTLAELAAYVALPEAEVEQILKMSLNALSSNEG